MTLGNADFTSRRGWHSSLLAAGSLTSRSSFFLGYLAQALHLLVSTSINIIVPLALGPFAFAEVIALTGPGYVAPIFVDQTLNTRLAFDAGAGQAGLLSRMTVIKLMTTAPAVAVIWLIFSRTPLALLVGLALATSFGLSTLFDAWLLSTARSALLVTSKVVLLVTMTGVMTLAVRRGPVAVAVGFVIGYGISALACIIAAFFQHDWRAKFSVVVSWRTLGLAGPMIWPGVYSWLLPLILVGSRHPALAADYKLAMAAVVTAVTLTPVPSLLVVAIAAGSASLGRSAEGALYRAVALAAIGGVAAPLTLALDGSLLALILGKFKYFGAVADGQLISVAVFPILLNPLLTARAYALLNERALPVVAFSVTYIISLGVVAVFPGAAILAVPVGQWALLLWLTWRNAPFASSVIGALSPKWAVSFAVIVVSGIAATFLPAGSSGVRFTVSIALLGALAVLALPFLRRNDPLEPLAERVVGP